MGRLLDELRRLADAQGGIDWEVRMVDGTSVRAHRCAAGGKGGRLRQALGRSRSGFGSKLYVRCHRGDRPMAFVLTPRHRHEQRPSRADAAGRGQAPSRGRPKLRPRTIAGDKGYTGRPVRDHLRRRGIGTVIPQLKIEKVPRLMDWGLYRERNVVERLVGKLKEHRRIATRYDKLAASYLAFAQLATIRMWF